MSLVLNPVPLNKVINVNEIVNKYLLAGYKFMPEMYLKQPGFTHSACGLLTTNEKRFKKFKDTGDSRYIYKNQ